MQAMIKRIFETHIQVRNLERAMAFYENVLGLRLGTLDRTRRIAFYWVGGPNVSMLGLWEKPSGDFATRHYAFEIDAADMDRAMKLLADHDLPAYNFLNNGTANPMVFAWMPALAIYFPDPDGNELEFIAPLPGDPRPELGIISLETWNAARI
jgi:lactoylglutathione lyase